MTDDAAAEVPAGCPPVTQLKPEKVRMREAAYRAGRLYPGPVGELLQRELLAYADSGFRLGTDSLLQRVVNDVMRPRPAPLGGP